MKLTSVAVLCVPLLGAPFVGTAASEEERPASEEKAEGKEAPEQPPVEETIARYRFASRPGREHRYLESLSGTWNVTASWNVPGRPPRQLKGRAENQLILGGRYLQSEIFLADGQSEISGRLTYGYDDRKSRFSLVAMNDVMSYYVSSWGTYDPIKRSFLFHGKERDEVSGYAVTYRQLLRVESDDRHVLQLFLDTKESPYKILDVAFAKP